MPLYEYDCLKCGKRFEVLIRSAQTQVIVCAFCGNKGIERVISGFAVSSEGTRDANIASARKRNLSLEREKQRTQIDTLHDHDH